GGSRLNKIHLSAGYTFRSTGPIRGEYYQHDAKRIVKTRKKRFRYLTDKLAPEMEIPLNADNRAIYEVILCYLNQCRIELPTRAIDTKFFEEIGSYINWKGLINI